MNEEIIILEDKQGIIEEIDIEEEIGAVAGSAGRHSNLGGRDATDQHPITSITGLRAELDTIESLQTVYSDQKQQADYYKWYDENQNNVDRTCLFVTAIQDENGDVRIKPCDADSDVIGVTVSAASMIGGHPYNLVDMNSGVTVKQKYDGEINKYGLVVTSGIVAVQRESDVTVGDYVVPDAFGKAKKSNGQCGYIVTALSEQYGVECAVISLAASSTIAQSVSDTLFDPETGLTVRMKAAEHNIVAVTNLANDAYELAKANGGGGSGASDETIKNIYDRIDATDSTVGSLSESINIASQTVAEAKIIADSAASKSNEAFNEAASSRSDAQEAKENAQKSLEEITELASTMQPLSEWSSDDGTQTGISGFVSKSDEESTQLALVSQWKSNVEDDVGSISAIRTKADANEASIESIASWQDETNKTMAAVQQKADANEAAIKLITEWEGEGASSLTQLLEKANANEAAIEGLTSWQGETNSAMSTLSQKSDANGAYIQGFVSNIAKYSYGPYSQANRFTYEEALNILDIGTVYVPDANHSTDTYRSEIYGKTDGYDEVTCRFLKGYYYTWKVDPNDTSENPKPKWVPSESREVTFSPNYIIGNNTSPYWVPTKDVTYDDVVYEHDCLYKWVTTTIDEVEHTNWIQVATLRGNLGTVTTSLIKQTSSMIDIAVTDVMDNVAAIQVKVDDNSTDIQTVTSWKSQVEADVENIATIKQTADDAGASIAQVAAKICGEYITIEGDWDVADKNSNVVYYTTNDKKYWYYKDDEWKSTSYPTEAGLEVNAASIVTAINNQGESGVKLSGNYIHFESDQLTAIADLVEIDASKIQLDGYVTLTNLETEGETTIHGGNITTGTIDARLIGADSLSAISANMGMLDAGIIQSRDYSMPSPVNQGVEYVLVDDSYYQVMGVDLNIETVVITASYNGKPVTHIAENAFMGYKNLKTVKMPDTITYIGKKAFDGCVSLKSIALSENISTLREDAFARSGLVSIYLPNSVKLYQGVFAECRSLVRVNMGSAQSGYSPKNLYYVFSSCSSLTHVNIPEGCQTLGNTFSNCTSLESVVIPSTVTDMTNTFANCTSLKYIYFNGNEDAWNAIANKSIPDGVTIYYKGSWRYDNENGFRISCEDSNMIDSKYFKVTSDGKITSTSGKIGGWDITEEGISKNNMRLISSDDGDVLQSLVDKTTNSQIRLRVGDELERTSIRTKTQIDTVNYTVRGDGFTMTHDTGRDIIFNASARVTHIADGRFDAALVVKNVSVYQGRVQLLLSVDDDDGMYQWDLGTEFTLEISYSYNEVVMDTPLPSFCVLEDGSLYAQAANLQGHIEASSGTVGGISIDNNGSLYTNNFQIYNQLDEKTQNYYSILKFFNHDDNVTTKVSHNYIESPEIRCSQINSTQKIETKSLSLFDGITIDSQVETLKDSINGTEYDFNVPRIYYGDSSNGIGIFFIPGSIQEADVSVKVVGLLEYQTTLESRYNEIMVYVYAIDSNGEYLSNVTVPYDLPIHVRYKADLDGEEFEKRLVIPAKQHTVKFDPEFIWGIRESSWSISKINDVPIASYTKEERNDGYKIGATTTYTTQPKLEIRKYDGGTVTTKELF